MLEKCGRDPPAKWGSRSRPKGRRCTTAVQRRLVSRNGAAQLRGAGGPWDRLGHRPVPREVVEVPTGAMRSVKQRPLTRGWRLRIDRDWMVIGRGRKADLVLSEATISRAHAGLGFDARDFRSGPRQHQRHVGQRFAGATGHCASDDEIQMGKRRMACRYRRSSDTNTGGNSAGRQPGRGGGWIGTRPTLVKTGLLGPCPISGIQDPVQRRLGALIGVAAARRRRWRTTSEASRHTPSSPVCGWRRPNTGSDRRFDHPEVESGARSPGSSSARSASSRTCPVPRGRGRGGDGGGPAAGERRGQEMKVCSIPVASGDVVESEHWEAGVATTTSSFSPASSSPRHQRERSTSTGSTGRGAPRPGRARSAPSSRALLLDQLEDKRQPGLDPVDLALEAG